MTHAWAIDETSTLDSAQYRTLSPARRASPVRETATNRGSGLADAFDVSSRVASQPAFEEADALLRRMAADGVLSAPRISEARAALVFLGYWQVLWGAPPPTDISDGSDGDFSLIWRMGAQAASLSFTEDEVQGYSYHPGLMKPWVFEGHHINAADLRKFFGTLKQAVPAGT